jgi:hypothetical protein
VQLIWTLDFLDDICADLRVFFGVEDAGELSGEVFFKLAHRLQGYHGAVRQSMEIRAMIEAENTEVTPAAPPVPNYQPPASDRVLTREELIAAYPPAPELGELVPMFEVTKCK